MATGNGNRTTRKPRRRSDDAVLTDRFLDAARRLGAGEREEAFDKAMRALLSLKPTKKTGRIS